MASQTDRFYAEIRKSHTAVSYVEVVTPDLEVTRLQITDGSVDCDRSAQIRRHITLSAVDPTGRLTPRTTGEILTPYGTEIRAFRGVVYSDGTAELAPLGVFRLSMCTITAGVMGTVTIQLEGFDRSRTISRDKFLEPYTIAAGANLLDAIKQIVIRTFPDAEYDAVDTDLTVTAPMLFDSGSDPWDACTQLAQSMGCEIYFDVLGRIVIAPPPDIAAMPAPDFSYIEGQSCTMLDLTRVFTDDPGYNGVIVTGESAGDEAPPVRAEAWDMNPSSPTYRYGPYGEVPYFVTDSVVKTTDDAAVLAASQLALIIGYTAQLSLSTLVNPSFEGGDVIEVKRVESGVDGLYVLDAFSVPLMTGQTSGGGTNYQTLTMRERRPTT
ncbi:DUF5047 domain-containing protein [Streptomyces sp. NPDC002754]